MINATIKGDLVIFAGAGISTETKTIFKETLYEDVLADMEEPPKEELDFPSLMTLFCKTNINGRQKLLQKIKYRFDYCQQFAELYHQASAFHQELSSIYYIKSIITTNWDDYFEKECGAIPIVIPEDFAFHNLPERKVYKIHGSISNYGTVIATKEDYDKCYRELNKGILGSHLKTILATKTVVFIDYSFRDYDFLRIYNYLEKELKSILPHCYIITLDSKKPEKVKNENLTVIKTDGTYFLSAIRKHLEGSKYLTPRKNISFIYALKSKLIQIHLKTSDLIIKHKLPNLVYCAFYQDGLRHALDYLIFHANSGLSFFPPKIFNSVDT
ncbi:MAG: SIR2 family protein [Cyclobacteriaceae bacterium]|nr:SIR2 family protein [Cyclobacteriaceae bacterium]